MAELPVEASSAMTVNLDREGLAWLRWAPGLTVSGDLARAAVAALAEACSGRRRPMLVDMTATAGVTREARGVFSQKSSASSVALVGRSAVDRVIANFVLGVTSVPVPTRFFTDEAEAVAWLTDVSDDRT